MANGAMIAGNFGSNQRNQSTAISGNGYISGDPITTYRVDYLKQNNPFNHSKNDSQVTANQDYSYLTDANSTVKVD